MKEKEVREEVNKYFEKGREPKTIKNILDQARIDWELANSNDYDTAQGVIAFEFIKAIIKINELEKAIARCSLHVRREVKESLEYGEKKRNETKD